MRSSQLAAWKCSSGHVWQARLSSVRAGRCCPICAHNQKLGLDQMRQIARERGGQCLSGDYTNGRTALVWECEHGHRWSACPTNVKGGMRNKGTWCPECYNVRRAFHARQSIEVMQEIAVRRKGRCRSKESRQQEQIDLAVRPGTPLAGAPGLYLARVMVSSLRAQSTAHAIGPSGYCSE